MHTIQDNDDINLILCKKLNAINDLKCGAKFIYISVVLVYLKRLELV
jgi:hypothetical protein